MGKLLLAVAAPLTHVLSCARSLDRRAQRGLALKMKMGWAGLVEASLRPPLLLCWGGTGSSWFEILSPTSPIALGEIANPSSPAAAFMRLGLSLH